MSPLQIVMIFSLSAWHGAWIGYCFAWLRKLARLVNTPCFLLLRQIWEGCRWQRMPWVVMQVSFLGQEAWFKIGKQLLMIQFEHICYGVGCWTLTVVSCRIFVRTSMSAKQCREWEFIMFPCPMTNSRFPFPFLPFLPTSSVHRWLLVHIGMGVKGVWCYVTSWVGWTVKQLSAL